VLAVSVILAMTFTFGCSDDKDKDPDYKWCEISRMSIILCAEIGKAMNMSAAGLDEGDTFPKGWCEKADNALKNDGEGYAKLHEEKPSNCSEILTK
jgi:hypothetical protein